MMSIGNISELISIIHRYNVCGTPRGVDKKKKSVLTEC